jgi:hypothetical protein
VAVPQQTEAAQTGQLSRQRTDRRRPGFLSFINGAIIHCRRRSPRRATDTDAYYVDWYDERLFIVTIGIFLLSCLDAFFTLILLSKGAEEVNPFMAILIDHGIRTFVYTKLAITGIGLIFLVIHAAFLLGGTIRVSHILYAVLGGYVTLVVYQVDILIRVL